MRRGIRFFRSREVNTASKPSFLDKRNLQNVGKNPLFINFLISFFGGFCRTPTTEIVEHDAMIRFSPLGDSFGTYRSQMWILLENAPLGMVSTQLKNKLINKKLINKTN